MLTHIPINSTTKNNNRKKFNKPIYKISKYPRQNPNKNTIIKNYLQQKKHNLNYTFTINPFKFYFSLKVITTSLSFPFLSTVKVILSPTSCLNNSYLK